MHLVYAFGVAKITKLRVSLKVLSQQRCGGNLLDIQGHVWEVSYAPLYRKKACCFGMYLGFAGYLRKSSQQANLWYLNMLS